MALPVRVATAEELQQPLLLLACSAGTEYPFKQTTAAACPQITTQLHVLSAEQLQVALRVEGATRYEAKRRGGIKGAWNNGML